MFEYIQVKLNTPEDYLIAIGLTNKEIQASLYFTSPLIPQ